MTREQKAEDIAIICGKCGCSKEAQLRHYKLFVDEGWQPHASLRFKNWWYRQPEYLNSKEGEKPGINAVVAQNVERIWTAYIEAKEIGAA